MDLGFARRQRGQKIGPLVSPELANLLARISARQVVSPTATAQMQDNPQQTEALEAHPQIAQFAPVDAREAAASKAVSFNADVAGTILTQRKPS